MHTIFCNLLVMVMTSQKTSLHFSILNIVYLYSMMKPPLPPPPTAQMFYFFYLFIHCNIRWKARCICIKFKGRIHETIGKQIYLRSLVDAGGKNRRAWRRPTKASLDWKPNACKCQDRESNLGLIDAKRKKICHAYLLPLD